jgi:hypothetical protein
VENISIQDSVVMGNVNNTTVTNIQQISQAGPMLGKPNKKAQNMYYLIGIVSISLFLLMVLSGVAQEDPSSGWIGTLFCFGGAYMIISTWMAANKV